jgi:nitroreductase
LENANRAPNHKQTEPWKFTVFTAEGLKYFGELELQSSIDKQYSGDSLTLNSNDFVAPILNAYYDKAFNQQIIFHE